MEIVGISGYSRSGKSSLIDYLREKHNYNVISTSQYVTKKTIDFYNLNDEKNIIESFKNKEPKFIQEMIKRFGLSPRDMVIFVAEKILVPRLGRFEGIVLPALTSSVFEKDSIKPEFNQRRTLIEVFNTYEYRLLQAGLDRILEHQIATGINIRRHTEESVVDTRNLVFEEDYWNESSVSLMGEFIHGSFDNYFQSDAS